jgi:hypothetical protein
MTTPLMRVAHRFDIASRPAQANRVGPDSLVFDDSPSMQCP